MATVGVLLTSRADEPDRARGRGGDRVRGLDRHQEHGAGRAASGEIRSGPAALTQEQQFAAFVAAHRDRAVGLAWRLVGGDGGAAEDVAQEAFARAYGGLARFRGDAQLSTWFYRILVNEAQRHLRWRWVRQRVAGEMPADPPDPSAEPPGDPGLRDRIGRAVRSLPRGQREAFVLVHLEGMTVTETAEITGRAVGTIKSHLHRALRSLREQLADLEPTSEATPT
jgi:RNA polymerase sigma-70 factor (ECF subfamily)